jgi:hypothetical protein
MSDSDNKIDQGILGETAKISWKELQFFFAAGKAIYVSTELDLVNVATQIKNDNKNVVEKWMQSNLVMPVPDDKAKKWYEEDITVWAVVIKPWVLVQQIKNN